MIENDLLKLVDDPSRQGWKTNVWSETHEISEDKSEVVFLTSHQARLGVDVTYGLGPDGYDQWVIREPHGGGSVIVPYLWIDGELYVGANRQKRSLTGGLVTEVPRGFALPTETHEEAARREFAEETGATKPLVERVKSLSGKPTNPNTAFFQANARKGEGVKLFGVEINQSEVVLRRDAESPRRRVYKFTPEMAGQIKEVNEKIKPEGIRFFHASLLAETQDGFTLQAISRLATQGK